MSTWTVICVHIVIALLDPVITNPDRISDKTRDDAMDPSVMVAPAGGMSCSMKSWRMVSKIRSAL